MASSSFKSLLLLLCLFSVFILPSSSNTITLNLSHNQNNYDSSRNPLEFISNIANLTLSRAYHLKHHTKTPSAPASSTGVFARGFYYSMNLSIGTPPQNIPALIDTASSLVWVPCTPHYVCNMCTDGINSTTFKPKKSSTKQSINCSNKRCRLFDNLDGNGLTARCRSCSRSSCSSPCAYTQYYASTDTSGHAISDNLNLQGKIFVRDFLLGCSSFLEFSRPDLGVVGFGRNPTSLPSQLKLKKFSYCFVSHRFDDTPKTSELILGGSSGGVSGVKYTPLLKNPPLPRMDEFYYVHLEEVTVGKKTIIIPHEMSIPDSKGFGGTIVDSGSVFTSIDSTVFDPIVKEYMAQLSPALRKRVVFSAVSTLGGNVLCVDTRGEPKRVRYPDMVFRFKGGVEMDLPSANYIKGTGKYLCLPFVNTTGDTGAIGPTIVLGNFQQQNFYIEFDLQNERLGLKKQICG